MFCNYFKDIFIFQVFILQQMKDWVNDIIHFKSIIKRRKWNVMCCQKAPLIISMLINIIHRIRDMTKFS